ncbi:hypothetical protein C3L33_20328, partial [Rhododendron williamsianum]
MTNLLSLLCFLSLLSNPSSSQPTEFTYTAFNQIGTNITLSGSSQILKNGILKLTNDTSRLKGHAFYTSPLKFKNSPDGSVFSFSTCFAVAIVPEYKKLGGHGLAFALSSTRDFRSALPSQYLGLLNNSDVGNFSNHLFAVEFDTVQDFEFRDINGNIVSCLFERMYVGFSASTGLLASSHYLLGWSFKMNGVAKSLSFNSLPSLPGPKKKQTALIIGISVSSFVFLVASILSGIYLVWKIKNRDVIEDWELEIGPHRYSYHELKQATKGFKDNELLGAGGFGRVYKGTLPNSKAPVAVKRISHNSRQGLREFVSEIASIGRLRHRNLVQLLGWCRRRGDLLLVYDFMPNGSLDRFLFNKPEMVLNWQQRFNIIKGVASALLYLHEGYEQIVVHRDVKASNVLLDSELNGRLGDFGLARFSALLPPQLHARVTLRSVLLPPQLHARVTLRSALLPLRRFALLPLL